MRCVAGTPRIATFLSELLRKGVPWNYPRCIPGHKLIEVHPFIILFKGLVPDHTSAILSTRSTMGLY
jgi:hypothetical protein